MNSCHEKKNICLLKAFIILISLMAGTAVCCHAYPIDQYEHTGIRRILHVQRIMTGIEKGSLIPSGARLPGDQICLRLMSDQPPLPVNPESADPLLQKKLEQIFQTQDTSYSLALLDITEGRVPRYAMWQPKRRFALGSVGKLAIAAGLFAELQKIYPDSTEDRRLLLKRRMVIAQSWIEKDHHDVPLYDPDSKVVQNRPVRQGDCFSLYEWADHMISASANAAASTLWKEIMLMRRFNTAYPPSPEEEARFFSSTSKQALSDLAAAVVNEPLSSVGITRNEFHLGSFFTLEGKKKIPGTGDSNGTPLGLLKFLVAMEHGQIVDPWSSLEIKRLMYSTARRIRYASSPALSRAAVFFKSGSLYRCVPEPEYSCRKYRGNKDNIMNSVAVVEHADGRRYLVALMTNVLKKNSAVDHQSLASTIDNLMK